MSSKVRYNIEEDLPVVRSTDVVVVGGGPGGIGAAVAAARRGARTLLVERFGILGGMATVGEVHPFMMNHVDGRPLDGPVYVEWLEKMNERRPREKAKTLYIDKDTAALAAEELCLEAGAELLYHHHVFDVLKDGNRITHVVLFSKSGLTAVEGKVFVDCTGDGDLAVAAGCSYEQGGPTGHCQPMTLCFKLGGVDRRRMPDRETINRAFEKAKSEGRIRSHRENVLFFEWLEDDVIHFNSTRILHKDGTCGTDLSEAEIEGRREMKELYEWLRSDIPGFENAFIRSMACHVGVRETRRIMGMDYIDRRAFEECRKFPDGIARARYPIDIHNPDGEGTEIVHLPEGEWYEIPYGCIVARDVENLLVGGRPISVDHAVHSSMRVMPIACSVGQAAGLAAALAAERGVRPRDLDGKEVRALLREMGARL